MEAAVLRTYDGEVGQKYTATHAPRGRLRARSPPPALVAVSAQGGCC